MNKPKKYQMYGYSLGFGLLVSDSYSLCGERKPSPLSGTPRGNTFYTRKILNCKLLSHTPRVPADGTQLKDVVDGLQYLHVNNIVHGDLTGPNRLIDTYGAAHLADFGLSITQSVTASWISNLQGNLP
ncbi:hypothetical protein EDB19DRAFT_1837641 [Suillus lakei]|nr:hypothetical protein EDB19DRAFT_1837641 [Suillus lakei]